MWNLHFLKCFDWIQYVCKPWTILIESLHLGLQWLACCLHLPVPLMGWLWLVHTEYHGRLQDGIVTRNDWSCQHFPDFVSDFLQIGLMWRYDATCIKHISFRSEKTTLVRIPFLTTGYSSTIHVNPCRFLAMCRVLTSEPKGSREIRIRRITRQKPRQQKWSKIV